MLDSWNSAAYSQFMNKKKSSSILLLFLSENMVHFFCVIHIFGELFKRALFSSSFKTNTSGIMHEKKQNRFALWVHRYELLSQQYTFNFSFSFTLNGELWKRLRALTLLQRKFIEYQSVGTLLRSQFRS